MPRGFGTRPQPWQCRIYQGHRIFASLKIGAVDGNPITCRNATETAKAITALLQESTNTAYQCVVAHRLGDSAAQALMGLAVELGDDFKVAMVSPDGHIAAEGYSQKAAAMERRLARRVGVRDEIKTIQPRRAG
jgi:hypothetical protein